MKILQITRQFLPATGGIESVVRGLSRAVKNAGHDVRVVTLKHIFSTGEEAPSSGVVDGVTVSRISHWGIRRYPIAPRVLGHVNGTDLLHIHAVDFFVDFLSLSKPFHSRPIVLSTHGGIFHTNWMSLFKSTYFRTITRQSLKRVSAVICVSEHDYEAFAAIVPREKLCLVRNGVEIEPYLNIRKTIKPGHLLGIGRVAENKGVDTLIRALAELREVHPNVQLTWVGPDESGRTEKLKELAVQLGVGNQVHFRGRVDSAELSTLLAQANLFVSSSTYEGYGLSTIEAMSSGTVPVVTPVGIHPQMIDDGKNGFLVDGNPSAFARALRAALSLDRKTLTSMGETARSASRQCSWDRAASAYLNIYQSVLSRA